MTNDYSQIQADKVVKHNESVQVVTKDSTKLKEESEDNHKRIILNISHDLKNPLSIIVGYCEMCLQGKLDSEKQKKYI